MTALAPFLLAQAATAPLTVQAAQTLPVADLAHIVLGEAGSKVVDIDRPAWPRCGGVPVSCPGVSGVPPLSQGMTFYYRPEAVSDLNWTGLCVSRTIKVSFGPEGGVERLEFSSRYKAPSNLRRRMSKWSAWQRADNDACATVGDIKSFFYASDDTTAMRGMIGLALFAEASHANRPLPFRFRCEISVAVLTNCTAISQRSGILAAVGFEKVRDIQQTQCPRQTELPIYGAHACYHISFPADGESVTIELNDSLSGPRLAAFSYDFGRVVY